MPLLRGWPQIGAAEQAFPFLSVDADGFPHSALLSRAELEPGADGTGLLAIIASTRTRSNLMRSRAAGLIAIDGTVCHRMKLALTAWIADGSDLLGCVFTVTGHTPDDIGVPMRPLTFRPTRELAEMENWRRGDRLFTRLREELPR
ncbi:hypothetical protein IU435_27880 [Nocardia cyriacigeorgica]|nr:hypothetical protein [Nocardia cyriacigeorgica]